MSRSSRGRNRSDLSWSRDLRYLKLRSSVGFVVLKFQLLEDAAGEAHVCTVRENVEANTLEVMDQQLLHALLDDGNTVLYSFVLRMYVAKFILFESLCFFGQRLFQVLPFRPAICYLLFFLIPPRT